jgi:dGTP triphosphohydrolase
LTVRAVVERRPVQIADVRAARLYRNRDLLLRWGYRSVLVVPLLHDDRVIGAMSVLRRRAGEFAQREVELVTTFAGHSAIALEHAQVGMSEGISRAVYKLRDFLFDRVYESTGIIEEYNKAKGILKALYEYYLDHIDEVFRDIPPEKKLDRHRMVCDFVAGMTDSFALMTYERFFLPQQWMVL